MADSAELEAGWVRKQEERTFRLLTGCKALLCLHTGFCHFVAEVDSHLWKEKTGLKNSSSLQIRKGNRDYY